MVIIRQLFSLLTPRERRNLYLLFSAILIMAGLEVVSVASIMPFLSVAADPSIIQTNEYLKWAYATFGFTSTSSFLVALGLGALSVLVVSNAFIVFTTWALHRYTWGINHSLSHRVLRSYLYRPYEFFLMRNSAEMGKNILSEVKDVANQLLKPALEGGAKGVVALFIISFLVFVDPVVAFIVASVLGASYGGIYLIVRKRLDRLGAKRVEVHTERYKFVTEAFGGIKEVKLRGKEDAFLNQYDKPSKRYAEYQSFHEVVKKVPRYLLEAVAFGGIILIAIYLIAAQNNIQRVIPTLGLYAFAGYRLMPALQAAFGGIASARYNVAALRTLYHDFQKQSESPIRISSSDTENVAEKLLTLDEQLVMEKVSYTYPGAEQPAIKDLSLKIPARATVGFVGKTGSGKTTAVDLLLGLLRPNQGAIYIDGTPLWEHNLQTWQCTVGYVPQHIFLTDDTIARNIAFGVPEEKIDYQAVEDALRSAQIHEFVDQELPGGLQTVVGEGGIRLSGGQRQRIGIARALYHQPSVLVFDEATSALDQATERAVMEAVYALGGTRTVILISHRLSTVRQADRIFVLERGRLTGKGSYENLYRANQSFRKLAMSGG